MRTVAIAGLALALAAPGARAQGIELSAGVNFATISGEDVENAARTAGLNLGIDLILPVGPLGLGLGMDFAKRGVDPAEQITDAVVVDLTYIELPINLRFPLVGAGPARLNVIFGPRIGINTGCKLSVDDSALTDCEAFVDGFEPSKIDWSATAGLGVGFSLGSVVYAGTELTYVHGFSDVATDLPSSARNRAFTLQALLGFDLF